MEHGYVYDLLRKMGLSDFQASTGEFLLVKPLKIALLLLAAMLIARIAARACRRFVRGVHRRSPLLASSPRAEQRAATVGDVMASIVSGAIWAVAVLVVLGQVGVDLAPLIAGAGIAGIAVGFGAQSLVKDFLAGIFVLLEDQYGVGDTVTLGDTTGTVEDVTLRITRIRSIDGTVWYIPNGEVRKVGNSSMEWNRAIVDVLVPYEADLAAVQASVTAVAAEVAADPEWQDDILEEPQYWGVQASSVDGRTVRLVAKAAPARQSALTRELRARVTERLRTEGVLRNSAQTRQNGA